MRKKLLSITMVLCQKEINLVIHQHDDGNWRSTWGRSRGTREMEGPATGEPPGADRHR